MSSGRLILLTYADDNFRWQAERLASSALASGFDKVIVNSPKDWADTEFARRNAVTLEQKRGGGYWLWKPYLIKRALENAQPQDIVLYTDAGRTSYYEFTRRPNFLEMRVRDNKLGYLLGCACEHLGSIANNTKRDCLILMNADHEEIIRRPILMTWSLWRQTPEALTFLKHWLAFAEDDRCLTDDPNTLGLPNYEIYREHRHDQSIMSILAYQMNAPFLDFSNTNIHRFIKCRPNSSLGHLFYKRPENADSILRGATPFVLAQEYVRIRMANRISKRNTQL